MKPHRPSNNRRTHINITNNMREKRLERKVTQQVVADEVEIPRGTYSTFEAGACLPTEEVLEDIARVLKCKVIQLYAGVYLDIIRVESED